MILFWSIPVMLGKVVCLSRFKTTLKWLYFKVKHFSMEDSCGQMWKMWEVFFLFVFSHADYYLTFWDLYMYYINTKVMEWKKFLFTKFYIVSKYSMAVSL